MTLAGSVQVLRGRRGQRARSGPGRADHAGHLLADLRAHRRNRASRGRVQGRARLVQRDRAGDAARRQSIPSCPRTSRRRLRTGSPAPTTTSVPSPRGPPRKLDSTPGSTRSMRSTPASGQMRTGRGGRSGWRGLARRARSAADEVFAGGAERQVSLGNAVGDGPRLPVGGAMRARTTSPSKPRRPARRAGAAAPAPSRTCRAPVATATSMTPSTTFARPPARQTAARPRARAASVAAARRATAAWVVRRERRARAVPRERRAPRVAREQPAPSERPAERAARREPAEPAARAARAARAERAALAG